MAPRGSGIIPVSIFSDALGAVILYYSRHIQTFSYTANPKFEK